ncbi:hypothetical protein SCANM63S_04607 [Streptomyces canarius]
MLVVGRPGLTLTESRSHFALWALLSAPLMAGNDIRTMSADVSAILRNPRLLAVNQDPLGAGGRRVRDGGTAEVFAKPLIGSARCAVRPAQRGECGTATVTTTVRRTAACTGGPSPSRLVAGACRAARRRSRGCPPRRGRVPGDQPHSLAATSSVNGASRDDRVQGICGGIRKAVSVQLSPGGVSWADACRGGVPTRAREVRALFEGFETRRVDVGEASVLVRYGGEGPPVVLLHGHPRTSATWHRVAPLLVRRGFTVVCPDLRGYGRSTGPAPTAEPRGILQAGRPR